MCKKKIYVCVGAVLIVFISTLILLHDTAKDKIQDEREIYLPSTFESEEDLFILHYALITDKQMKVLRVETDSLPMPLKHVSFNADEKILAFYQCGDFYFCMEITATNNNVIRIKEFEEVEDEPNLASYVHVYNEDYTFSFFFRQISEHRESIGDYVWYNVKLVDKGRISEVVDSFLMKIQGHNE